MWVAHLQIEPSVVFDEQEVDAMSTASFVGRRSMNFPMDDGGLESGGGKLHVVEQFVERLGRRSVPLNVALMFVLDILKHRLYRESIGAACSRGAR